MSRNRIGTADIFDPSANVPSNKPDRNFGVEPMRDIYCYTIHGKHDAVDGRNPIIVDNDRLKAENNPLCFAKKINTNGSWKYYIKTGDNGAIFNPIGMYQEGKHNAFDTRKGKSQWRFTEVNLKTFNYYVAFLRTKNKAFLECAEREKF